jgi:hypothetical protein
MLILPIRTGSSLGNLKSAHILYFTCSATYRDITIDCVLNIIDIAMAAKRTIGFKGCTSYVALLRHSRLCKQAMDRDRGGDMSSVELNALVPTI